MTTADIKKIAQKVREDVIEMGHYASERNKGAHLGGGLSCVDIMAVLYAKVMKLSPENIASPDRDILMPGKAHCILPQFATLYELGCISKEDMYSFAEDGGILYGHACHPEKGVDFPGGSLGMALPVSVGMALGKKSKNQTQKIYCLLGDGECDEGSVWEAAMAASHYKLDNLVAIVDRNYVQLDGLTEDTMALGDMGEKFRAFGWDVLEVDGHSIEELEKAFDYIPQGRPLAIIARTIKGKGVSFMEGRKEWHFSKMTNSQYEQAKEEIASGKN